MPEVGDFKPAIENYGAAEALIVSGNWPEFEAIPSSLGNRGFRTQIGTIPPSLIPSWIRNHGFVWGYREDDRIKEYLVSLNESDGRGLNFWKYANSRFNGIEWSLMNTAVADTSWIHSGNAMVVPDFRNRKMNLVVGLTAYDKVTPQFKDFAGERFGYEVIPMGDGDLYRYLEKVGPSSNHYFYDLDTHVFPHPERRMAFFAYPFPHDNSGKPERQRLAENMSDYAKEWFKNAGYETVGIPYAVFGFHDNLAEIDGEKAELVRYSTCDLYSPANVLTARTEEHGQTREIMFLLKHYSPQVARKVESLYREHLEGVELVGIEPGYLISEQMGPRCGTVIFNSYDEFAFE